jgi:predicted nuclease of restriction endonuclease-like RecB superfamily
MLPTELLRVRISGKVNQIRPVFYAYEKDDKLSLPSKIIRIFEEMADKQISKANVDANLSKLEAKYTDYKLVRGICHLLEQRCVYASPGKISSDSRNNNTSAIYLRRKIFEESSRIGYPITENERKQILETVASKNNLTIDELEVAMWNDLDKNKYLKNFDSLSPLQLVAWYNISILQTLLLNCVELVFSVYGGFNWKKILRKIKQLGLMYFLYYESNVELESNNQTKNQDVVLNGKNDKRVICAVDGPLSIVRLTDRYGVAMAKLVPLIIFTELWSIDATILRKSISGAKKTYRFQLSHKDKDLPLFDASNTHFRPESNSEPALSFNKYDMDNFDSNVERKFMDKFLKFSTGWKLTREPDPLILSDGKAFIPDFVFEKYGIKVYLEIVGFWTKEYLKRKLEKIKDLLTMNSDSDSSLPTNLLIAANMDNYISENGDKIRIDSIFSDLIARKHLILYKKDEIPFGPIVKYLKDIDSKIIDDISINLNQMIIKEIENKIRDKQNKVIFLKEISDKLNIPLESVLKTTRNLQSNNDDSTKVITNRLKEFLLVDNYIISNDKINELLPELDKIKKLQDAIKFLDKNNIPEECITLLIPKIGFDIVWNGIDSNNAIIQRQSTND